jgi:hypothetical protein
MRDPAGGPARQKTMNVRSLALVLCAASMVTVACSDQPKPAAEAGASHVSPGNGTLNGRLVTSGGPAPGAANPVAGTVTVTGKGVHVDVKVGEDGAYSISVPPGHYKVTGHSPSVVVDDREAPCSSAKEAKVARGTAAVLDVVCSIK